jgi:hypothetical protein
MERRLRRLDVIYQRRASTVPALNVLDLSRLTIDERLDLDDLLARVEGLPSRPDGRPDLSPLSEVELERIEALAEKVRVNP